MNVLKLLKAEPVASMAVVTAVLAIFTLVGIPKGVTSAIGGLIAALLAFPVRNGVAPMSHVVKAVTAAASDAAVGVAAAIDTTTAGAAGVLTPAGGAVVNDVVDGVVGTALSTIGVKQHA
jgi:hypothetical protein